MSHMTHFYVLLLALGIGVIAGLRSFTAPAVVAWAAALHWINLNGTWASWVGNWITVGIFTVLALGELFVDKQPKTPPRTAPPAFIGRIVAGGVAGGVVRTPAGRHLERTRRRRDRRGNRHPDRRPGARRAGRVVWP